MNKYNFPANPALIQLFQQTNPKQNFNLIQLGCNTGVNLQALYEKYPNANYFGCDINTEAIDFLKEKEHFKSDNFLTFDLNKDYIPFKTEYFDYILCLDILQHLRNPQNVIHNIKNTLKPDGVLIASIPNLSHYSIIKNLLVYNRFTYTPTGLLDNTHIHLFTGTEAIQMFKKEGFLLNLYAQKSATPITKEEEDFIEHLSNLEQIQNKDFFKFNLNTFEFLFICKKETNLIS